MLASSLKASGQRPALWFGALLTFVVVAWHLVDVVLGIVAPARDCVSLWVVMGAGFAGALAMAGYLGRAHPRMRRLLHGDRYA